MDVKEDHLIPKTI